ncbi:MAG: hypothetical protein AAB966_04080, partial [Patescibacteria group bacterium]
GNMCSLVNQFIKKSSFAQYMALILPITYKKPTKHKHFDSYFHLLFEIELPANSFLFKSNIINVKCVFQIWKKLDYEREPIIKHHTDDFKFVRNIGDADIVIKARGMRCGRILEIHDKKIAYCDIGSKCRVPVQYVRKRLCNLVENFDRSCFVACPNINQQEIIKYYNQQVNISHIFFPTSHIFLNLRGKNYTKIKI